MDNTVTNHIVRIKNTKEAKDLVKSELLQAQNYICPLCGGNLAGVAGRNIVLDHDHSTGYVRAAVHRSCNAIEGKIKYALTRYGQGKNMLNYIARLYHYWVLHKTPQTCYIYPTHRTADEKRILNNKRARKRYAIKNKSV